MRSLDRGVERVCEAAAIVCGAMLIASAICVSIDLVARKIFNQSFIGANEISGYVLAVSTAWAFSYAILKRVGVTASSRQGQFDVVSQRG